MGWPYRSTKCEERMPTPKALQRLVKDPRSKMHGTPATQRKWQNTCCVWHGSHKHTGVQLPMGRSSRPIKPPECAPKPSKLLQHQRYAVTSQQHLQKIQDRATPENATPLTLEKWRDSLESKSPAGCYKAVTCQSTPPIISRLIQATHKAVTCQSSPPW